MTTSVRVDECLCEGVHGECVHDECGGVCVCARAHMCVNVCVCVCV